MTSIPTTLSTISSHPVAEELTEELDQLLDAFCSDVQQQFCLDQHVATQHQLSNIKSTIQHARTLLNGKWLLDAQQQQSTTNEDNTSRQTHLQARQTVMRTCLEMIDSYQAIAHQRQLRNLPEGQATKWMHVDWQHLSQKFDIKAREQTQWTQLLTNLKELQKAWEKKPQNQVNKIIHSFLMTSFDPPTGCHIVVVDRHNYAQLGLKRKAIGSRQLVFECYLLSRQDQMAIIGDLCQRFATVFGENAHHNLAHIDAQLKRGQPHDLQLKCQALYQQLFLPLDLPRSPSMESSSPNNNNNNNNNSNNNNKSSQRSSFIPSPTNQPSASPPSQQQQQQQQQQQSTNYLDPLQQQRVDQWYATQDQQQIREQHHLDEDNQQQQEDRPPSTPPPVNMATHHHTYQPHDTLTETKSPIPPLTPLPIPTPSVPMALRPTPFIDTTSLTLQHIPLPSFIPSPWQWPDLLKIRQPYRPILFGLIKRRKTKSNHGVHGGGGNGGSGGGGFFYRLRHLFYSPNNINTNHQHHHHHHGAPKKQPSMTFTGTRPNPSSSPPSPLSPAPIPSTPTPAPVSTTPAPPMYPVFASISMTQLGQHFIWTSQRFYQDIMLHCQLKYQQDSQVLKEVGSDLVQMYAALQLDISRLAMQRVVTILHELHTMDPPAASVDAADVLAAASASASQADGVPVPQSIISLEGV